MALFDIKLFSTSLLTNTDVRVIIPTPDEPFYPDSTPYYQKGKGYQVLYLLHGAFGDCTVWNRYSGIERYAQTHKLAIVSASVTNSCYLDMAHGPKFLTYMTQELPRFIQAMFPVSSRREDTFIAGISMGGYGAYRIALETPERFGCAVSLSGGLEMANLRKGIPDGGPSAISFANCFGDDPAFIADNDLLTLLDKRLAGGSPIPKLYQCCGTEDFLYKMNLHFRDQLRTLPIDLTYEEGPGKHNWEYWDPQIQRVLEWLPLVNTLVDL